MVRYRTIFTFALFTLVCTFVSVNVAGAQNLRPWTVQSVSGEVQHTADGVAKPIQQGASVGIGSMVSTGPNARIVLVRGTESMMMSPKSEIAIPAETGSLLTRIIQNLGTLLLKVEKRPDQHFEVKTPYLAAIVKGTSFTVSVDQRGSAVHVVSGLVQVNDLISGQTGLVKPGRTGIVTSRPGGGLKISGGRSSRKTKQAKAKVEKKKLAKTDASTDQAAKSGQKAENKARNLKARNLTRKLKARNLTRKLKASKRKARNQKFSVRKAARSSAARKVALNRGKDSKGLAIVTTLGIAKIDISAVTNGFVKADVGSGKNAGATLGEDEKLAKAEVVEPNGNSKVSKIKRNRIKRNRIKRNRIKRNRIKRNKIKRNKIKRKRLGKQSRRGKAGKRKRG